MLQGHSSSGCGGSSSSSGTSAVVQLRQGMRMLARFHVTCHSDHADSPVKGTHVSRHAFGVHSGPC